MKEPSFLSTVLPGQLPICCFAPVMALKRVDFPVLGLPVSPMVKLDFFSIDFLCFRLC